MKETNLDIINHSIQGIMDCSYMMNLFCLLKMNRLYKQQCKRLKVLMYESQQFNKVYINKYSEIPKVSSFQQALSYVQNVDNNLVCDAFNAWIDWENRQIELCSCLLQCACNNKERNLFKNSLCVAKAYLNIAKNIKYKYFKHKEKPAPQNIETKQNMQQLKLKTTP